MKRLLGVLLVVFAVAMLPVAAFASDGEGEEGTIFKIDGNVVIAAGQTVGSVIVIDGDVRVDGIVRDILFVINGDVTVTGRVGGTATVIDGQLDLASTAVVKDIQLVDATLVQGTGSLVTGKVSEREDLVFDGFGFVLAAVLWSGFTALAIGAGAFFALVAPRQMKQAAALLTQQPAGSIVAALVLWVATPLIALSLVLTLVGAPIGLGAALFLLPAAWFLGYALAGYRLGAWALSLVSKSELHPVFPTVIGVLLLQLIVLIPVAGIAAALVLGSWGAGALALAVWRHLQQRPMAPGLAM